MPLAIINPYTRDVLAREGDVLTAEHIAVINLFMTSVCGPLEAREPAGPVPPAPEYDPLTLPWERGLPPGESPKVYAPIGRAGEKKDGRK